MTLINDVSRLWGELTALKIDIAILREQGANPETLLARQMRSIQLSYELRQACDRVVCVRRACGRALP